MSVSTLLSTLIIHPDRVTHEALASCAPRELASLAESEQVVPQALAGLEKIGGPSAHADVMRDEARRWTLYEALQRNAVADLLDACESARALFFKGASLAYSTYPAPSARMRQDWDVLVTEEDAGAVARALLQTGFERDLKTPGRIRTRQSSYRRAIGDGECTVDLHTGLVNAPAVAARTRFDDLFERSMPLPSLHPSARGTSEADALVIACVHRLVHHSDERRMVWDYDIHLLTRRLADAFDDVMRLAAAWRVEELVAREVARAASRFDTPLPPPVAGAIRGVTLAEDAFARENRSRAAEFLIDWRGLGWRDRAALARETFLPGRDFVRSASGSKLPLPLLYLRRLLRGASGWLRPPRRGSGE